MIYIGIDPGQNGGIAIIDSSEILLYKYSDERLIDLMQWYGDLNISVWLENVQGFPGRNPRTAIAQGKSWGVIVGILKTFDVLPIIVQPSKWKKEFNLLNSKLTYKEKKLLDVNKAKELFPDINLVPPKCKVEHDGMADALLIAEYGRRKKIKAKENSN